MFDRELGEVWVSERKTRYRLAALDALQSANETEFVDMRVSFLALARSWTHLADQLESDITR
jgi:hypothetical protein